MSRVHYFREHFDTPGMGMSTYHAVSDTPNDEGKFPTSTVTTVHHKGEFVPTYDPDTGHFNDDYLAHTLYNDYDFKGNVDDLREAFYHNDERAHKNLYNDPNMHNGQLFQTISEPRTELSGMFSHPSMRIPAMTLGKLAADDAIGGQLVASDSLSRHSSRLTKHAIALGFPVRTHPDNPNADVTNGFDFDEDNTVSHISPEMRGHMMDVEKVPQGESKAAYEHIQGMIRNGRKRNNQPVTAKGLSDQFTIPGMEGF